MYLCSIDTQIRVQPNSLDILMPISRNKIKLKSLNIDELFVEIFKIFDIVIKNEAPGKLCESLIIQMGGLRYCHIFRFRRIRELIKTNKEKFPQGFSRGEYNLFVHSYEQEKSNKNITFYDHKDLEYEIAYEVGSGKSNYLKGGVLEYLINRKVLIRGLKLCCTHCNSNLWISLTEIKKIINCKICKKNSIQKIN